MRFKDMSYRHTLYAAGDWRRLTAAGLKLLNSSVTESLQPRGPR